MREQDFQQQLRIALTAARLPVRLWRQPAGRLELARGGFVDAAPVGAADLTGFVTGTGVRFEVEVKGPRTPVTTEQVHWREVMRAAGVPALLVRYDGKLLLEENLTAAVAEIRAAVEAAACTHPDATLICHPEGGVHCTRCGWRNGGRAREAARG
jgi:hypothetical protein